MIQLLLPQFISSQPAATEVLPRSSFPGNDIQVGLITREHNMVSIEHEEQAYQADVAAVKQWWTDSRWRFTKRPFTAEQIVAKRGNLGIEYPSNVQSKKLWKILEGRWKVGHS